MNNKTKKLFSNALELNEHDRAVLAQQLLNSLEHSDDKDLTQEWLQLAEKRWQEIQSGKGSDKLQKLAVSIRKKLDWDELAREQNYNPKEAAATKGKLKTEETLEDLLCLLTK